MSEIDVKKIIKCLENAETLRCYAESHSKSMAEIEFHHGEVSALIAVLRMIGLSHIEIGKIVLKVNKEFQHGL